MADGLEITVQGADDLDKMLDDLGAGDTVDSVCRRALREGGNLMKAAIAANAPVRTPMPSSNALPPGTLQSDITVTVSKDSENSYSAWIEPGKFSRHVAIWVEWGHRLVRGKSRKGLPGRVVGDVPAHPYIRPAFDANEDLAFEAVAESLAKDINTAYGGGRLGAVETETHGGFEDDDGGTV